MSRTSTNSRNFLQFFPSASECCARTSALPLSRGGHEATRAARGLHIPVGLLDAAGSHQRAARVPTWTMGDQPAAALPRGGNASAEYAAGHDGLLDADCVVADALAHDVGI